MTSFWTVSKTSSRLNSFASMSGFGAGAVQALPQPAQHLARALAHAIDLVLRLLDADGGRVQHAHVEKRQVRRFLGFAIGNKPADETRHQRDQRQKDQGIGHVKPGVNDRDAASHEGIGGLPAPQALNIRRVSHQVFDQLHIRGEQQGNPEDAEHVEDRVKDRRAAGVRRGADRGQQRGDRRADVFAEHERRRGVERDHAGLREADGDPERGRRGLHEHGQQAADCGALQHAQVVVGFEEREPLFELGQAAQGFEAAGHELQAEKNHADAHDGHGHVAGAFAPARKGRTGRLRRAVGARICRS